MKRTTLFAALASAFSLSFAAYAHEDSTSQTNSDWSKATQRVESMNDQQGPGEEQSQSPAIVKQAQEKLSAMGKDVGTPDGQLDAKTRQVLKEYQQENGLQATGQLDRQTMAALDLDQTASSANGGTSSSSQDNDTRRIPAAKGTSEDTPASR